ncbi:MAG: 2-oxo acid dehydrogenase subunit E2 [Clostridiales bacterium]|nr:2-oxo acid dehydrogenase subunit E2 [Clostridiales bacterium]
MKNNQRAQALVGKKGAWKGLNYTRERFGIIRKIIAHVTVDSWDNVPHVSFTYEPDVTEFIAEYRALKEKHLPEANITLNTLLLKAIVEALKAAPHLNAYLKYNKQSSRGSIDTIEEINISIPSKVDEDTTVTVNLKNANKKSLVEINDFATDIRRRAKKTNFDELYYRLAFDQSMDELKEFKPILVFRRLFAGRIGRDKVHPLKGEKKRDYYAIPETERLTLEDVRRGTLVVTNIGSIMREVDLKVNLLEIIPPQILAIALCPLIEVPRVVKSEEGSKAEIRKVLPICIAFDHRAYDFVALEPFVSKLEEIFASPKVIRSW